MKSLTIKMKVYDDPENDGVSLYTTDNLLLSISKLRYTGNPIFLLHNAFPVMVSHSFSRHSAP